MVYNNADILATFYFVTGQRSPASKRPTGASMPKESVLPLLLLDRDGTLIEEGEYMTEPRQVKLLRGALAALRNLQEAGFSIVVLSNQSGVGYGLITRKQMTAVGERFLQLLRRGGVTPEGYYVCPHRPQDGCRCRKPQLALVKRAAKKLKRSWRRSISIGDRPSDVTLGQNTGGAGWLVKTGYGKRWWGKANADRQFKDLGAATAWLLKQKAKGFSDEL